MPFSGCSITRGNFVRSSRGRVAYCIDFPLAQGIPFSEPMVSEESPGPGFPPITTFGFRMGTGLSGAFWRALGVQWGAGETPETGLESGGQSGRSGQCRSCRRLRSRRAIGPGRLMPRSWSRARSKSGPDELGKQLADGGRLICIRGPGRLEKPWFTARAPQISRRGPFSMPLGRLCRALRSRSPSPSDPIRGTCNLKYSGPCSFAYG